MSDGFSISTSADTKEVNQLTSAIKTLQRALEQFGKTDVDILKGAAAKMQKEMDALNLTAKSSGKRIGQSMAEGMTEGMKSEVKALDSLKAQAKAMWAELAQSQTPLRKQASAALLTDEKETQRSLNAKFRAQQAHLKSVETATQASYNAQFRHAQAGLKAIESATQASLNAKFRWHQADLRDTEKATQASYNAQFRYVQAGLKRQQDAKELAAKQAAASSWQMAAKDATQFSVWSPNPTTAYGNLKVGTNTAAELKAQAAARDHALSVLRNQSRNMWATLAAEEAKALSVLKAQSRAMWAEVSNSEAQAIAEAKAKKDALFNSLKAQTKVMWANMAQAEKEGAAALKRAAAETAAAQAADLQNWRRMLALRESAMAEAAAAARRQLGNTARAQVNNAMLAPAGAYSSLQSGAKFGLVVDPAAAASAEAAKEKDKLDAAARRAAGGLREKAKAMDEGTKAAGRASGPLKVITNHLTDMHSAARGVASGFGMMWLTWGKLTPLLAGAALSNSLVQTVQKGREFESVLSSIEFLGQTGAAELNKMSQAALSIGSSSQFGPIELAKGLKTLTLAGLDSTEALSALRPVMDFSVVSELPLDKAAESLLGISKAFGFAASSTSVASDVVAKAAAVSMSSVSDMTEAFKQSSTVAQQFGATIQDQSVALALLAQVGIKGSAAGTAVRNMYVELTGTSKKAKDILQNTLKLDIFDNVTKSVRPLPEIMRELGKSLSQYKFSDQIELLNKLGNERGMKSLSAYLSALATQADATGQSLESMVSAASKMESELSNSAGFTAIAAAGQSATTDNVMKSVGNALQSSMIQAFKDIEPYLLRLSIQLREALSSQEFIDGLSAMARGVGQLAEGAAAAAKYLYDHADAVKAVLWGLAAFKAASYASTMLSFAAATPIATAALSNMRAVILSVSMSSLAGGVALNGLTAAVAGLGTAVNVALRFLGPLGIALSVAAAAWGIYSAASADAASKEVDDLEKLREKEKERAEAARLRNQTMMQSLDNEIVRLNKLLETNGDAAKAQKAVDEANALSAHQQILNEAKKAAAVKEVAAAKMEEAAANALAAGEAGSGTVAGQYQDKANALRQEAKMIQLNAQEEVRGYKLKAVAVQYLSEQLAAQERFKKLMRDKSKPTGDLTVPPDTKSNRGKAFSFHHDNELAQIEKRYADELSTIKGFEKSEQTLLKARHESKLVNDGQFYAQEMLLAQKAESDQLALIERSKEQYTAAFHKQIDDLEAAYDAYLVSIKGKDNFAELKTQATEKFNLELKNTGDAFATFWQKVTNDGRSIEDATTTRITLQAIKARGAIKALDTATEEFWRAEEINRQKAANQDALEDVLRYATPESAAYLTAAARENERLTDILVGQDKVIKLKTESVQAAADAAWLEFDANEELNAALATQTEELKKLKEARDKLAGKAGELADAEGMRALTKFRKDEEAKLVAGVADAIVTGLMEGGQAGKKKLRDLIVNELRKPVTLVVQAVVQTALGAVFGGFGGRGQGQGQAGFGVTDGLNAISAGKSIYGAYTSLAASGGAQAGTLWASNAVGSMGGDALGSLIATNAEAWGVAATEVGTASATAAGGLSELGAAINAIPGWGWALAAVAFIANMLDDSGTPHTGGLGSYSSTSGFAYGTSVKNQGLNFDLAAADYNAGMERNVGGMSKAVVDVLDSSAQAFGKKAGAFAALAFADDASDDSSWGGLLVKDASGKVVIDWGLDDNNKWPGRDFADGEEGLKDYATAVAADMRDYLITQLPEWADNLLNALGTKPTFDDLATTVQHINDVNSALGDLTKVLPNLAARADATTGELDSTAVTGMVQAAGGPSNLAAISDNFMQAFYSEVERGKPLIERMRAAFAENNLTLPTTIDGYRALAESIDPLKDPGALVTVMQWGATFTDMLHGVSEAFGLTADSIKGIFKSVISEAKSAQEAETLGAKKFTEMLADGLLGSALDLISKAVLDTIVAPLATNLATTLTSAGVQLTTGAVTAGTNLVTGSTVASTNLATGSTVASTNFVSGSTVAGTNLVSGSAAAGTTLAAGGATAGATMAAAVNGALSQIRLMVDILSNPAVQAEIRRAAAAVGVISGAVWTPGQATSSAYTPSSSGGSSSGSSYEDIQAEANKLNIELLKLSGKTAEALALQRAEELKSIHPTNRALQELVWLRQDEREQLDEAFELENQLLRAQGKEHAAVTREREKELAALKPANRALQEQVWALEDLREAATKFIDAVEGSMDTLLDSKLFSGSALQTFKVFEIVAKMLSTAGVDVASNVAHLTDTLGNASSDTIRELAMAFIASEENSAEAKGAVLEAAGALIELRDAAEEAKKSTKEAAESAYLSIKDAFTKTQETLIDGMLQAQKVLIDEALRTQGDILSKLMEAYAAVDAATKQMAEDLRSFAKSAEDTIKELKKDALHGNNEITRFATAQAQYEVLRAKALAGDKEAQADVLEMAGRVAELGKGSASTRADYLRTVYTLTNDLQAMADAAKEQAEALDPVEQGITDLVKAERELLRWTELATNAGISSERIAAAQLSQGDQVLVYQKKLEEWASLGHRAGITAEQWQKAQADSLDTLETKVIAYEEWLKATKESGATTAQIAERQAGTLDKAYTEMIRAQDLKNQADAMVAGLGLDLNVKAPLVGLSNAIDAYKEAVAASNVNITAAVGGLGTTVATMSGQIAEGIRLGLDPLTAAIGALTLAIGGTINRPVTVPAPQTGPSTGPSAPLPPTVIKPTSPVEDVSNAVSGLQAKYGVSETAAAFEFVQSAVAAGDAIGLAQAAIAAGVPSSDLSTLLALNGVQISAGEIADWAISQGLPRFAGGGMHRGGLRIVGENGPELEATGAARIWNADQTRAMLSGGESDDEEVLAALAAIQATLADISAETKATASHTNKTSRILSRVSKDGESLTTSTLV